MALGWPVSAAACFVSDYTFLQYKPEIDICLYDAEKFNISLHEI